MTLENRLDSDLTMWKSFIKSNSFVQKILPLLRKVKYKKLLVRKKIKSDFFLSLFKTVLFSTWKQKYFQSFKLFTRSTLNPLVAEFNNGRDGLWVRETHRLFKILEFEF